MNRICFVVQRYGLEVNGGAELLTRELAERLTPFYEVHVLTSKAIDYITWKDEYKNDLDIINEVVVHRFSVTHQRKHRIRDRVIRELYTRRIGSKTCERQWVEDMGPYVPSLISYITDHSGDFQVFIFCTYLYYPTVIGLPLVKDKAVLLPFAHNEPFIKMQLFDDLFNEPKAIVFQTEEEKRFVYGRFHNDNIKSCICGAGVTLPKEILAEKFKQKFSIDHYIVYVGRIDRAKNCRELFDYFKHYKKIHPGDLKLVLIGKPVIRVPHCKDIIALGFISDEDKYNGISGADCLVLPSKFESLSIVVLEAFSLMRPVLINSRSDVLVGHCNKSGGGYAYCNFQQFAECLQKLEESTLLQNEMGYKGYKYVMKYYRWDEIINRMKNVIEDTVTEDNKS
jgi:glycosyltransferase involved in cell wall biosynthesis